MGWVSVMHACMHMRMRQPEIATKPLDPGICSLKTSLTIEKAENTPDVTRQLVAKQG